MGRVVATLFFVLYGCVASAQIIDTPNVVNAWNTCMTWVAEHPTVVVQGAQKKTYCELLSSSHFVRNCASLAARGRIDVQCGGIPGGMGRLWRYPASVPADQCSTLGTLVLPQYGFAAAWDQTACLGGCAAPINRTHFSVGFYSGELEQFAAPQLNGNSCDAGVYASDMRSLSDYLTDGVLKVDSQARFCYFDACMSTDIPPSSCVVVNGYAVCAGQVAAPALIDREGVLMATSKFYIGGVVFQYKAYKDVHDIPDDPGEDDPDPENPDPPIVVPGERNDAFQVIPQFSGFNYAIHKCNPDDEGAGQLVASPWGSRPRERRCFKSQDVVIATVWDYVPDYCNDQAIWYRKPVYSTSGGNIPQTFAQGLQYNLTDGMSSSQCVYRNQEAFSHSAGSAVNNPLIYHAYLSTCNAGEVCQYQNGWQIASMDRTNAAPGSAVAYCASFSTDYYAALETPGSVPLTYSLLNTSPYYELPVDSYHYDSVPVSPCPNPPGNGDDPDNPGGGEGSGECQPAGLWPCVASTISGDMTCDEMPVCTGDKVFCSLEFQNWKTRCNSDKLTDGLFGEGVAADMGQSGDMADAWAPTPGEGEGPAFDDGGWLGGGGMRQCPQFPSVMFTVPGLVGWSESVQQDVNLNEVIPCSALQLLGSIIVFGAYCQAAYIVGRA